MSLRLLIADDHEITRLGVRMLMACKPDWEVCGEAIDGWDAVAKVQTLLPDVVILDVFMLGKNGFEAAAEIRQLAPKTKIVFFSMHEIPASARRSGGDAFVSKTSPGHELISAIESVLREPRKPLPND